MFSFSFISGYFLISHVISSLIHWLLKNVLFNFHKFVNCLLFLPIFLISSQFGWRRYLVWYLSFKICWDLICVLIYGISWKMTHVHLRRMYILLCSVFWIGLLYLVGILCSSCPLFTYFPYGCSIQWEWGIEISNCYCRTVFLPSVLLIFFLHILWRFVIWCVNVYNCYIFLLCWTFY